MFCLIWGTTHEQGVHNICVCVYVYVHTQTHSHCTLLSDWESICTVTGAKKGKKIREKHVSAKCVQVCETIASD
jgi:hypothetical protein